MHFYLCTWAVSPRGRVQEFNTGHRWQGFYSSGVGAFQMRDLVSKIVGVTGPNKLVIMDSWNKDMTVWSS